MDHGDVGDTDVLARTPGGQLWLYEFTDYGAWGPKGRQLIGTGWNSFVSLTGTNDWTGDGRPVHQDLRAGRLGR